MELDESKMFISYATKYDSYVGHKNWNELTLVQRKAIAEFEFAGIDLDYESFVIDTGLKKLQAQGIRALCVSSQMLNERLRLINPDKRSDKDTSHLLSVFANTKFFREMNSLLQNKAEESTDYTGLELERLAQTNRSPSVLDDALDMDAVEARRFIQGQLEVLHKIPVASTSTVPVYNELSSSKQISEIVPANHKSAKRRWSIFDIFVCSEVKWIKECIEDFFHRNQFMVGDDALRESLKIASDSDKAKYSIRVDGMKPAQVALLIVRNVALSKVSSGANHVYRGVLSAVGKEYEKMFICAVRESVLSGFDSEADASSDIAEMRSAVKEVG